MSSNSSNRIFAASVVVSILIHLCFFASWSKIPRREPRALTFDKTRLVAISRYEKKADQKKAEPKETPKPDKPEPLELPKPPPRKPTMVETDILKDVLKDVPKKALKKTKLASSDMNLDRSKMNMNKPKLVEDGFRGVGEILARDVATDGIGDMADLSGFSIREDRLKGRMKGFETVETEAEDEGGLGGLLPDRAASLYEGQQVSEGEGEFGGPGGSIQGEGLQEISMKGLMSRADFSQNKAKIIQLFGKIRQCLDLIDTGSVSHQSIQRGGMSANVDIRNGRFHASFCSGMTINFNKSETGLPMVAGKQGSARPGCSAGNYDIFTYLEKSLCILQNMALHREGSSQCL